MSEEYTVNEEHTSMAAKQLLWYQFTVADAMR